RKRGQRQPISGRRTTQGDRPMPSEALPDLSSVLAFRRSGKGWSQGALAKAAGISLKVLNDQERGRRTLTRERLEQLIALLGLPPAALDATPDPPPSQPPP